MHLSYGMGSVNDSDEENVPPPMLFDAMRQLLSNGGSSDARQMVIDNY